MTELLAHPFLVHALVAGTAVAIIAGMVGYFVVLRSQVFAGDALGHVGYTGAMAALAAGVTPWVGLFVATIAIGGVLGWFGGRTRTDDVMIGSLFSWTLGLGALFATYYTTHGSADNGVATVNVLFGSIFGLSSGGSLLAVAIGIAVVGVLTGIGRPLLFATIDRAVARAAGVPVILLDAIFLAAVGATVAEATQVVGALVSLGLLAAPAATATRLTTRPWRALLLSTGLSIVAVWVGMVWAYLVPSMPASFTIMATAAAGYLVAATAARGEPRRRQRNPRPNQGHRRVDEAEGVR